jgi:hypothetical protein
MSQNRSQGADEWGITTHWMRDSSTACVAEEVKLAIGGDYFADIPSPWRNFSVQRNYLTGGIVQLEIKVRNHQRTPKGAEWDERRE